MKISHSAVIFAVIGIFIALMVWAVVAENAQAAGSSDPGRQAEISFREGFWESYVMGCSVRNTREVCECVAKKGKNKYSNRELQDFPRIMERIKKEIAPGCSKDFH